MKLIKIIPSDLKTKKYTAYFELDNKKERKINFGAKEYRDFTLLNDKSSKFYEKDKVDREKIKAAYLARHEKNEDWNDPLTAGALSRWILWDLPTLGGSINKFKRKFKL